MSQEPPLVLFTPKSRRIIAFAALQEQYQVLERFGRRCAYGQRAQATTWDHIIPASRDEQTKLENWVPACNLCSSEKRDQEVLAWMRSRAVHLTSSPRLKARDSHPHEWVLLFHRLLVSQLPLLPVARAFASISPQFPQVLRYSLLLVFIAYVVLVSTKEREKSALVHDASAFTQANDLAWNLANTILFAMYYQYILLVSHKTGKERAAFLPLRRTQGCPAAILMSSALLEAIVRAYQARPQTEKAGGEG